MVYIQYYGIKPRQKLNKKDDGEIGCVEEGVVIGERDRSVTMVVTISTKKSKKQKEGRSILGYVYTWFQTDVNKMILS